ncbi:lipopolysaccharide-induced tumor necrosis factor-alpha factor homolog [Bradysia coprophila]|uniref:lipopolysaccharide-induced tumor necrosis factor-alpha factor homolog n=1 Tax=Bradysia coprophila TaxID=38358 RepID=UPI00187D7600|nr:lipopolysaccharide-induced tumor necrosis factor-alpha factor homolog [Bradysia coprophila]
MAHSYEQKHQPSIPQYSDTPALYPTQYIASAPTEFQAPPPQYSVVDPSLQQQQPHIQQLQRQPQSVPIQQQVQHVVVLQIPLARHPVNTTCPSCHSNIVTKVKSEPNVATHIIAGVLCFLCWLPCVCLPYCMESCQSSVHYCPNCAAYLGAYRAGVRY